jgi:hypothetical protein
MALSRRYRLVCVLYSSSFCHNENPPLLFSMWKCCSMPLRCIYTCAQSLYFGGGTIFYPARRQSYNEKLPLTTPAKTKIWLVGCCVQQQQLYRYRLHTAQQHTQLEGSDHFGELKTTNSILLSNVRENDRAAFQFTKPLNCFNRQSFL